MDGGTDRRNSKSAEQDTKYYIQISTIYTSKRVSKKAMLTKYKNGQVNYVYLRSNSPILIKF